MTLKMKFGDEPPVTVGRNPEITRESIAAVKAMRDRPGEWCVVWDGLTRQTASNRRQRLTSHGCEATVRIDADGGHTVWARWPG